MVILAEDLIWATRLSDLVTRADRVPRHVHSLMDFGAALRIGCAAIIDLTARGYDGISAVEMAAHVEARILCVGQHDDLALRKRALNAGAQRVLPYRALFERGAPLLQRWLDAGTDELTDAATDGPGPTGGDA